MAVPAVALMGPALSDRQVELLRASGTRFLTSLLDGDGPGAAGRQDAKEEYEIEGVDLELDRRGRPGGPRCARIYREGPHF
jgi:hypothetical protein